MAAEPVSVPIHVASLGPANLRMTGELADGWIGTSFLCGSADVFLEPIRSGAEDHGRSPADVELSVAVSLEITADDEEAVRAAGRRHAAGYAFTFGAMGSASTNFYNNAFTRQGFGEAVAEVQRLWLAGDREAARAAVPIEIGLGTNLIGPPGEIARRIDQYRTAGIDLLRVRLADPDPTKPLGLDGRLAALETLMTRR